MEYIEDLVTYLLYLVSNFSKASLSLLRGADACSLITCTLFLLDVQKKKNLPCILLIIL